MEQKRTIEWNGREPLKGIIEQNRKEWKETIVWNRREQLKGKKGTIREAWNGIERNGREPWYRI